MKKIIFSVVILLITFQGVFAQAPKELPGNTAIPHYKLSVGYRTTTVLIFPIAIDTADRGLRDVMVQKQTGLPSILKIKARKKGFQPTNLHVFLVDGHVYAFDLYYATDPEHTTYDLSDTAIGHPIGATAQSPAQYLPATKQQIQENFSKIRAQHPFMSSAHKSSMMKITLQSIYQSGDCMYIGLQVKNYSSLPFDHAGTRICIRDRRQVKRSSIQEQEVPVIAQWQDAGPITDKPARMVIAIKKTTLAGKRRLVIEFYESGGERKPVIKIPNRFLVRARSIPG